MRLLLYKRCGIYCNLSINFMGNDMCAEENRTQGQGDFRCSDPPPPQHQLTPLAQSQQMGQQTQVSPLVLQPIQSPVADAQLGTSRLAYSHLQPLDKSQQVYSQPGTYGRQLDPVYYSQVRSPTADLQVLLSPIASPVQGIPSAGGSSQNQQQPQGQFASPQGVLAQSQFFSQPYQSLSPQQPIQAYVDPQEEHRRQEELYEQQRLEALRLEEQRLAEEQQKMQACTDYQSRVREELEKMSKHQSLEETLLPQLHNYFNYILGDDGHDATLDPYHGPVFMLQHKLNPSYKLCLKTLTISNYQEWETKERELQLQKLEFTHPHLVNIHIIHSRKFLCLCSATFRLCLILDHIGTDMSQLAPTKHFYEEELWHVLDATIDVLYVLQMKGIDHQNVGLSHIVVSRLINDQLVYKLLYKPEEKPYFDGLSKGTATTLPKHPTSKEPLYVSPLQWDALRSQGQVPGFSASKSDVFVLGMTVLHLALGPSRHAQLESIYETAGVNEFQLNNLISLLKEHYSKYLVETLMCMLRKDEYDRPNWVEMSLRLSNLHSKKVFAHQAHNNSIYDLELQQRAETKLKDIQSDRISLVSKSGIQSLIPSHFSEIKHLPTHKQERTHNPEEEEFIIEQFLLSGTRVELRHQAKREFDDCYYDGEIVNGKRDGVGQAMFKDGRMYDGCWKDDQPNGQGVLYDREGVEVYNGQFKRGVQHGFGVQRNPDGQLLREAFDYTNFHKLGRQWNKYLLLCNIRYDGDHQQGNFHGFGNLELTNKEKYVGAFVNGVPEGVGVFHTIHQGCINGQWENGRLVKKL